MKKIENKTDFTIKVFLVPCLLFLVWFAWGYDYTDPVPNFYEVISDFFEDFDPLAIFKGGRGQEPTNIHNLTK